MTTCPRCAAILRQLDELREKLAREQGAVEDPPPPKVPSKEELHERSVRLMRQRGVRPR